MFKEINKTLEKIKKSIGGMEEDKYIHSCKN